MHRLACLAAALVAAMPAEADPSGGGGLVSPKNIEGLDSPAIAEASRLLFDGKVPARCVKQPADLPPEHADELRIKCMIGEKYARDPRARELAQQLYEQTGNVAGVGEAETMDGGYRGKIKLVPQLPAGQYRQHLQWVVQAGRELDEFFATLARPGPGGAAPPAPRFRWRDLSLRFVRSVAKRTPSAYALGWSVTYNVRGSLLQSATGVSETMFHEIFHLNDGAHDDWSARVLADDYNAILARCQPQKLSRACLAPYAPGTTTVRGGTYYAFQQNNGESVHEYAAELALRYYKEHRELAATGRLAKPAFKCGAPENARAWKALADEFFAGVDHTGDCK